MRYEDESGPELSGDENQIPVLKQTIVEPSIHALPDQPEKLTLPDGRTQPLIQKRVPKQPKPPKPPTVDAEPKTKPPQYLYMKGQWGLRQN